MEHKTEFALGLIGSIWGIINAIILFILGIFFWGGFYEGFNGIENKGDELTQAAMTFGIKVAALHAIFMLIVPIFTIVKCQPKKLQENPKGSGGWILTMGILMLLFNPLNFIPAVLVIISGGMCLSKKKPIDNDKNNSPIKTTM